MGRLGWEHPRLAPTPHRLLSTLQPCSSGFGLLDRLEQDTENVGIRTEIVQRFGGGRLRALVLT